MALKNILLLASAALTVCADGIVKGFNYGAQGQSTQSFAQLFSNAQQLTNATGFDSARLYTMIQEGTQQDPTSALRAAIDFTNTTLLLGIWCSAGEQAFEYELAALGTAIQQYGDRLRNATVGLSVGSEDLYRDSQLGIENMSGPGAGPDLLVDYIKRVRAAIMGTALDGIPIGHVDTWTGWANDSNAAVVDACDFVGMDAYPYYQQQDENHISNAANLFFKALDLTKSKANGKPVWVAETGWPTSGPTYGSAVASVENAQTYWREVGCKIFGNINTWWYELQGDAFAVDSSGSPLQPDYDLSCPGQNSTASNATSNATFAEHSQSLSSGVSSWSASTFVTSTISTSSPRKPANMAASQNSTNAGCGTSLTSSFEFPHLIVPVNSSAPNSAYGTSYNGLVNSQISSVFGFDIPQGDADKTCTLVFLLPNPEDLQTSSYTLDRGPGNGGGLAVQKLGRSATTGTTYGDVAADNGRQAYGGVAGVAPGGSWVVNSEPCSGFAGQAPAFYMSAVGGLALEWFQDFDQPPIGLYMNVC